MYKILKPAILYKEDIERKLQELYYSEDMFFVTGSTDNFLPAIETNSSTDRYQYAVVTDRLIGYMEYKIDFYVNRAYDFIIISFTHSPEENYQFGKAILDTIDRLTHEVHSIEWIAVDGNPVCRAYDKIIRRYCGRKLVLRDTIRDKYRKFHDKYIYEIIIPKSKV